MRFSFAVTVLLPHAISALTFDHADNGEKPSRVPNAEHETNVAAKPAANDGSTYLRTNLKQISRTTKSAFAFHASVNTEDNILKNKSSNDEHAIKECLLTSDDADVGILSCDEGHYCRASSDSKLGGVCSAITRKTSIASLHNCPSICTCCKLAYWLHQMSL